MVFHPVIARPLSDFTLTMRHGVRYCCRGKTISTFACVYSFTNDRGTQLPNNTKHHHMRHILLALLLTLVGGVALAQGVDEAWLEGTLVSKTDKTPLVNALVALRTAEGKDTSFRTITDEKGYFLLKAIPGK